MCMRQSSALWGCYRITPVLVIRAEWQTPGSLWCLPIPLTSSCTSCTATVFISWRSCMGDKGGPTVSNSVTDQHAETIQRLLGHLEGGFVPPTWGGLSASGSSQDHQTL